ncbi:SLIT and NTRK-like protein 3 isoform X3 [Saccopteryx bilineata]|uniref:SLIT and NTRK-like protein 3 isoform X3 n=1 Tax=Saccopteryx bilineata TaxID=59482 RepID=UPI00338F8678
MLKQSPAKKFCNQPRMMEPSIAKMLCRGKMLWIILLSTIALGWTTPIPLIEDSEEIDEPCFDPCYCEVKESLFHIHCDSKGFTNISQITEFWSRPFKLYLQRNSMRKLYTNSFLHLNNAVSINLGNNALQDIQTGAFNGLKILKRLYLHENKLDVFRNDTFLGLESLEYLQADYNVIKRIESGAFRNLSKLRVLILNDNLIPMLPTNLFKAISLTHLDLRGNRLKVLFYRGMLDHIGRSLMELQLEENPWNCTCEIVQLKNWLERIPYTALVGDITCETPFHFHGKDLREIRKTELCPLLSDSEVEASLGVPHLSSNKENTWPTKPSSMLSSVHFTASSVEYKSSNKHPKPTKQPRTPRPPSTSQALYPGPNQPPIAPYQTRPPIPIICPTGCTCNLHINDLGLTVNCKERGFNNISELLPRPLNAKKLYLSSNLIQKIYRSDFWNFSSLDLLHLGNNRISYVQDGAFINLPNLKSLFLNGNDIEKLTPAVFVAAGLFAFVLRRRQKKLPFRTKRQEGVDLTGIQMQCHRLFEDGGGGGGGSGAGGRPPLSSPEKAPPVGHVYEYIPHPVTQMCNNPIYKPREEEEVAISSAQEAGSTERGGPETQAPGLGEVLGSEQFAETPKENHNNYRTLLEKEKEWALAVSRSQLNTIVTVNHHHPHPHHPAVGVSGVVAGTGGDLAGFRHHERNGGVVLFPPGGGCGGGSMLLDRERPQPAPCTVGFMDCLYGTVPKLKELHVHPPGMQYPDLQQDARLKETLLFSAGKGFSDHQTQKSDYLELRAKLQTKPDYLEVLEKTVYRF